MNGLILFSHGSVLCGSGEALEAHAAGLRAREIWDRVGVGYLNYSTPTFADTVDWMAAEGVTEIIVTPYFLAPGYFVSTALPRELTRAQAAHPEISFTVAEAMKHDSVLVDAILDAAETALPPERWRDGLARAAAACRGRDDCPLYATPCCPLVPRRPEADLLEAA